MQSASPPVNVTHDAWQKLAQECAQGATYDSNERQPHSTCLPGTRVDLLRSLKELVYDGKRKIVWVSGESGSGKSTVAHTLADELRGEGKLAATFFFSRKHTKRSTFDYVLLTLAYQLGLHHHSAKEVIVKAITDDPALLSPEKSCHELLEKLIMEPMRELAIIWKDQPGMSIIFDALDEGANNGTAHIAPFLFLLARLVKDSSIPIRNIIISSRPWPEIGAAMDHSSVSSVLETVQVEHFDSHEDITRFLRHSFDLLYSTRLRFSSTPKPWPSEEDFLLLSEHAHGRFIFAATIVRFIDQDEPQNCLQLVCTMLRRNGPQVWGDVHRLYSSIIDEVDPLTRAKGLRYLSLIVNLAEPLSIADLDRLLDDHVHSYLLPFSALISIPPLESPQPVAIFHTSFRDFLQQKEQDKSAIIHRHLASSCFRTMSLLLKRDICGLEDPSLLHDEIPDFVQKRDSIPRALRYACLYWLHHLQLAAVSNGIQDYLLDFLQKRVLFAIEAYAVLGELGRGVETLREARKLIAAWSDTLFAHKDDAMALLYDGWRLTLDFFDPISVSALHVYESALPCSPARSRIRHVYSNCLEQGTAFVFEEGLDDEWGCVIRAIDVETRLFNIALSPDTSQVAAITPDSVRVWDTATGLLVASLPISDGGGASQSITHNGSHVAFQRKHQNYYVWCPSDGTLAEYQIGGTQKEATLSLLWGNHIALSGDGSILACFWVGDDNLLHPQIITFDVASHEQLSRLSLRSHIQILSRSLRRVDNTIEDTYSLNFVFSGQGNCLTVHFRGYIHVFNPFDGQLLSRARCEETDDPCDGEVFFGPNDEQILHVWRDHQAISISQFSFSSMDKPRIGLRMSLSDKLKFSLSATKVQASIDSSNSQSHQPSPIVCAGAAVRLRKVCKVERIKSADHHTPPGLQPQLILYSGELVGVKMGDHMTGLCMGNRTSWMTKNKQCFGAILDFTNHSIQLVDVAQAASRSPSPSAAPTTDSNPGPGYELMAISAREDMEAYKSVDSDTYLIFGSNSLGSAVRWELAAGTNDTLIIAEFSPNSTYLAIAFRDNSSSKVTQFQVWDLILRIRVVVEYPQYCNPTDRSPPEIRFSYDDSALALVLPSATGDIIAYYSLEGNILQLVASFSSPQPLMYQGWRGSIGSVTQDAIHFWARSEANEGHFPYLYRWSRDTLVIERLVCTPRPDLDIPPTISPSSTRIYYREKRGLGAMDLRSSSLPDENIQSGDAQDGLYQIDEDHDPDCYYDTLSWSDLCMTTDGWLRKRSRRICWLPARYRPSLSSLYWGNLRLIIEGSKVTILDLDGHKRITIRLLHTVVEFFD